MDTCNSKQTPLRDSYVSCTEPVNPYHGNYVSINLTKPWALNIPPTSDNLWDMQNAYWDVTGVLSLGTDFTNVPQWSDPSRNFLMPTHCVRYWSNGSYWWNPQYYEETGVLEPVARAARYPEAQIGDLMYLRATLLGQAYFESSELAAQHSVYDYNDGVVNADFYKKQSGGLSWTNPLYGSGIPFPPEYYYLNYNMNVMDSSGSGLSRIGGFNLTCFVVDAVLSNAPVNCRSFDNASLSITIKPLVPYSDLSGCWLLPPTNYTTGYPNEEDWDGLYIIETMNGTDPNVSTNWGFYANKIPILPAITANFSAQAKCFYVTLPVQLYTARGSSFQDFTFSLVDVSGGAPIGPVIVYDPYPSYYGTNMVTVATKLKGVFLDVNGEPTTVGNADSIQFEIVDPKKVFHLNHTFEDAKGGLSNRPIFCTETGSIPIKKPGVSFHYSTSLLFSPRCGPGIWTNLPAPPEEPPKNWLP